MYQVTVFFDNSDAAGRTQVQFVTDNNTDIREQLWASEGLSFVAFLAIDGRMIIVDRSDIQHIEIVPSGEKKKNGD